MPEADAQDRGGELIEDCRYCGDPLDTNEDGHFKTPGEEFAHPDCLADACYSDRERVATTEGVFRIKPVTIMKHVGNKEEVIEAYWQAKCPVCWTTHETETQAEDLRNDFVDEILNCCGAEWLSPSDWIEDCEVCGEDHREKHDCMPPALRDPFPGVDEDYSCTDCEWGGHGTELTGPNGECPNCDSPAVEVLK